jgi:hypothetical protein
MFSFKSIVDSRFVRFSERSILPASLCLALLAVALSWMFRDLCGNDLISEAWNPKRTLKAIVFRRSCGATTGYSYHVSVVNPWDKLTNNEVGTVFRTDEEGVTVNWEGDSVLRIVHPTASAVFHSVGQCFVFPSFRTVKIRAEARN